jgi:hypothetical protein
MPTLEVQLAKAQKDMDALVDSGVDRFDATKLDYYRIMDRELTQRIRYLQQRLEARNERAELRAAAQALMLLRGRLLDEVQHAVLPIHTFEPTAPE